VQAALDCEKALLLDTLEPYLAFAERVAQTREALRTFFAKAKAEGKGAAALGASTKGNVLLQYCGVTESDILEVGEVNPEKFGSLTPGTFLPIVSEDEVLARNPDYLLILPWHFRDFFCGNPKFAGRKLIFPLPHLEMVIVGQ
jgi:NDP-4-keto-2,6-dideoxyhexose 3-C-methyltransferase